MKILFISLFSILLTLPLLDHTLLPMRKTGLVGIHFPAEPSLSVASLISGDFQREFEPAFMKKGAIWGYLLKSSNQINFSLFSLAGAGYSTSTLVGKNNYLYQRLYVEDINNQNRVKEKRLVKRANRIKLLQDLARDQGKAFLLLISPSKTATYPDLVPNNQRSSNFKHEKRNINVMKREFDRLKVNYLDKGEFVKDLPYPIYNRGGSHYTPLVACLVTEEIIRRVESQLGKNLNRIVCKDEVTFPTIPQGVDRDLSNALNLWFPQSSYGDTPTVEISTIVSSSNFRPSVFIVGTSFIWAIRDLMEQAQFYSQSDFFFYASTNYFYRERDGKRERGKQEIDKTKLNLQQDIFKHDVILIEANEALVSRLTFGLDRLNFSSDDRSE